MDSSVNTSYDIPISMNGKGDTPRPLSTRKDIYDSRFESIFGKKARDEKKINETYKKELLKRKNKDKL